jgi:hypothetical protein
MLSAKRRYGARARLQPLLSRFGIPDCRGVHLTLGREPYAVFVGRKNEFLPFPDRQAR